MPFTAFHLGPAFLLAALLTPLALPPLIIGSIAVDVEPALILVLGLDLPLHGFLHSLLFGVLLAFILSFIYSFLLGQKFIFVFFFMYLGHTVHVILDSMLYSDIKPFLPFGFNPLYGLLSSIQVTVFCVLCFITSIIIFIFRRR
ncbi:MAG: hypothetical protein GF334_05590 [Candidatus Altiarchaeales archaeon]|nr:hypothetical protein [Candidatus Altiarchaeales archaeon]